MLSGETHSSFSLRAQNKTCLAFFRHNLGQQQTSFMCPDDKSATKKGKCSNHINLVSSPPMAGSADTTASARTASGTVPVDRQKHVCSMRHNRTDDRRGRVGHLAICLHVYTPSNTPSKLTAAACSLYQASLAKCPNIVKRHFGMSLSLEHIYGTKISMIQFRGRAPRLGCTTV